MLDCQYSYAIFLEELPVGITEECQDHLEGKLQSCLIIFCGLLTLDSNPNTTANYSFSIITCSDHILNFVSL